MTDEQREPVMHEASASIGARATITASGAVERVLNGVRLAVLGILIAVGLSVGFGVDGWPGVVWGAGSFVVACAAIKVRPVRHLLMSFMHWLTEQ